MVENRIADGQLRMHGDGDEIGVIAYIDRFGRQRARGAFPRRSAFRVCDHRRDLQQSSRHMHAPSRADVESYDDYSTHPPRHRLFVQSASCISSPSALALLGCSYEKASYANARMGCDCARERIGTYAHICRRPCAHIRAILIRISHPHRPYAPSANTTAAYLDCSQIQSRYAAEHRATNATCTRLLHGAAHDAADDPLLGEDVDDEHRGHRHQIAREGLRVVRREL